MKLANWPLLLREFNWWLTWLVWTRPKIPADVLQFERTSQLVQSTVGNGVETYRVSAWGWMRTTLPTRWLKRASPHFIPIFLHFHFPFRSQWNGKGLSLSSANSLSLSIGRRRRPAGRRRRRALINPCFPFLTPRSLSRHSFSDWSTQFHSPIDVTHIPFLSTSSACVPEAETTDETDFNWLVTFGNASIHTENLWTWKLLKGPLRMLKERKYRW